MKVVNMNKKVTNFLICMFLASMMLLVSVAEGFGKSLIGEQSICSRQFQSVEFYDDGWSMFRHDIKHSGYSTSSAPNTSTTMWSYSPTEDTTWFADSSPAVENGKVYVGACSDEGLIPSKGYVYCFDEFSGEVMWSRKTDGWVTSSPAISDNKVYVGSLRYFSLFFNGTVYCLDSGDGSILWSYQTIYKVCSSPTVSDERVYFGSTDLDLYNSKGEIVCLDSNNGNLIWKYIPDKGILSSTAISNDRLYVGCMDGKLYCLNSENGSLIWNHNIGGRIRSSPTISDNKVYIGSLNGKIYCLNAENGDEFWNFTAEGDVGGSPAVGYGNIYIGTYYSQPNNKAIFYCLDALSGTQIWNFTTQLSIVSSASIADSKVYIGLGGSFNASKGNITCLNALNGNQIWNYPTKRPVMSSPAICNGRLYVSSYEGSLYCFCDDLPPTKPSRPSGPVYGEVGVSYNYSTSTTDPNGDMVRYGWDWNGDKEIDEWTSFHQSGATVTKSHTWQQMGIHIVRVRAEDAIGTQSEWSNPLFVIMPQVQEQQKSINVQTITIKGNTAR